MIVSPVQNNVTRGQLLLLLRRPLIAALHACLVAQAWIGAFAIRLDFVIAEPYRTAMLTTLPLVIVVKLAVFYAFRLFQGWWRYVGLSDLVDIGKAATAGTLAAMLAIVAFYGELSIAAPADFPRSVFLLDFVL